MEDRREHIRHMFIVDVKIVHPDIGEIIVKTKNISDGGVFIVVEPKEMPPIGEIVQAQVQGESENLPIMRMEIVRTEGDGIGLKFIDV